jgi:formylglycine-generating enzyme required for sulfatase activity
MVLVPAGEFTMGDNLDGNVNAIPISTTVSAFYMDVNEVTLSQWKSVYDWARLVGGYTFSNPGSGKGANYPVHTLTWYDCVKWCNARSEREGKAPVYYTDDAQTEVYRTGTVDVTNAQVKWTTNGYRLPTEAEWEKAARGGLSGKRFPWGDTISQKLANYTSSVGEFDLGPSGRNMLGDYGTTNAQTSPVGSFAANGYGLYDMSGNVAECCWDKHGTPWTPYAGGVDPHGSDSGSVRTRRGGGYGDSAWICRIAERQGTSQANTYNDLGFRAVLPAGQP